MEADFGGWATVNNLPCTDGRTILPNAFEEMDGKQVPLVFQHGHADIENVLGHVTLENRPEGVYALGYFNSTPNGQLAKTQVQHKDLKSLSIFANNLVEKTKKVAHGVIREVSLVLAGANPGALIDYVALQHGDGSVVELDDAAVIHTGLEIELYHDDDPVVDDEVDSDETDDQDDGVNGDLSHASDMTVQDVIDSMSEEQKNALYFVVGTAVDNATNAADNAPKTAVAQSDIKPGENDLAHQEGADNMSRNVFDQSDATEDDKKNELSHDALKGIFQDATKCGSLKEAVNTYAMAHGITDIDVLFPDAKAVNGTIELDKRRTEWVATVLNGMLSTPFSRVKTFVADLTQDDARAKGYIKGTYKKEEWFGVTKRTTGPTTIYKKQQLDRDDMLDITDFDIVSFLKGEMRLMTEEEVARAVLIGDGRDIGDEDKVKDPAGAADGLGVRSILNDHELFVTTLNVNVDDANSSYEEVVDAVMDGFEFYKGTGTPTFFTTIPNLNKFLKARDLNGQRYYKNRQEVADALGVDKIVTVEPMKEIANLIGIIVNLQDYNVGTDRGGELTTFDDFDIDYNKYKYLMETRMSGALVRPKSAIVIMKTAAANVLVTPNKPGFVKSTGVVTIVAQTGVVYKNEAGTTLTAGAQTALAAGETAIIYASPASGYYFPNNQTDSWPFKRDDA